MVDKTLQHHEDILDNHEDKIDNLQHDVSLIVSDVGDIKTRLGIKDITNGNVLKYQQELVQAQQDERDERKEQDVLLMQQISKIDNRLWYIVVSIIFSVCLEILISLM